MADISFGNININDNGSINLSSKVLGVDLNELVDGFVKAKSVPISRKEVEVSKKSATLAAYEEYEGLLSALKNPASNLRRPSLAQGMFLGKTSRIPHRHWAQRPRPSR